MIDKVGWVDTKSRFGSTIENRGKTDRSAGVPDIYNGLYSKSKHTDFGVKL